MESYDVSLVTISRQNSYDSGILLQEYGIIGRLPMNHTRIADSVTVLVVHLLEWAEAGGRALLPHRTKLCGPCIAAIANSEM